MTSGLLNNETSTPTTAQGRHHHRHIWHEAQPVIFSGRKNGKKLGREEDWLEQVERIDRDGMDFSLA